MRTTSTDRVEVTRAVRTGFVAPISIRSLLASPNDHESSGATDVNHLSASAQRRDLQAQAAVEADTLAMCYGKDNVIKASIYPQVDISRWIGQSSLEAVLLLIPFSSDCTAYGV